MIAVLGCARGKAFLEEEMFIQPQFTLSLSKRRVLFVKEKELKEAISNLTACIMAQAYPKSVFVEDFTVKSRKKIPEAFTTSLKNLTQESFINRWVEMSKTPDEAEVLIKGELFWGGEGTDLVIFLKGWKDGRLVAACSQTVKVRVKDET